MDLVVRRQSEQLDRRNFAESHNENTDQPNSSDVYDHRKWEWGHLRVTFKDTQN